MLRSADFEVYMPELTTHIEMAGLVNCNVARAAWKRLGLPSNISTHQSESLAML